MVITHYDEFLRCVEELKALSDAKPGTPRARQRRALWEAVNDFRLKSRSSGQCINPDLYRALSPFGSGQDPP